MTPPEWTIDEQLELARTPPAEFYLDGAFFDAEKARIFGESWQLVGRAEQIEKPGDYFTFEIAGEPGVVVRDAKGKLHALSNVCRHRASVMLSGSGNVSSLQCPYHAWTYDLSGRLAGSPEFDGVLNWRKTDVCLPRYAVEVWGPLVFVHLGAASPSLETVLGEIPSDIEANGHPFTRYRFLTRREYVVRCNWKIYIDNYLEGYHIPPVHPALFRELDYANYRVETFRYYSAQHAPLRPARGDAPRRYDPATTTGKPLYYWLFPNTMLNVYPDNLQTNSILPLGPEETLTIFDWFTLPENPATADEVAAFSDQVQKEDIGICENVAKGLRSRGYHRGRYSVRRENGVHHFHRLWQEAMGWSDPQPS